MAEETLKDKIKAATVQAMRSQEKEKLGVIRLIQAAIQQQEVDESMPTSGERIRLDDQQVLQLLDKMIRQRRDSIKHFEAANRTDLVNKENFEIGIIQTFLPSPLSAEEIGALIQEAIQATEAREVRDMAKVMERLKPKLQGRADIGAVGKLIKERLSS